jgi:hypothetical protein
LCSRIRKGRREASGFHEAWLAKLGEGMCEDAAHAILTHRDVALLIVDTELCLVLVRLFWCGRTAVSVPRLETDRSRYQLVRGSSRLGFSGFTIGCTADTMPKAIASPAARDKPSLEMNEG